MNYSRHQFIAFRVIFGLYLFIHFAMLIPYGAEIFGLGGALATPDLNLTYKLFPSIFFIANQQISISIVLGILCLLSLLFAYGKFRRTSAVLLWFGWASLFNANNFIANPGIPYVGWLLLACAVIPNGESETDWKMPKEIFWGAWLIMALGYSISGYAKMMSPSWQDGTGFKHLISNPLARDYFLRDIFLKFPLFVHKLFTWGTLVFEFGFAFLCLFSRGRMIAWTVMIFMHIGILFLVNFADLTFGMLMLHIFTFDPSWIKASPQLKEKPILFFDGVCGLCNGFVDFLFEVDKNQQFLFSPLQSTKAAATLSKTQLATEDGDFNSSILFMNGKTYEKSDAVLKILRQLGGYWTILGMLIFIPRFIRDGVYEIIAKNRYKLFGKKDTCRLPTPSERARFSL